MQMERNSEPPSGCEETQQKELLGAPMEALNDF